MTTEGLDGVLAAIDGALADDEWPDAMRWSPDPEQVDAARPFDGEHVTVGPEHRSGVIVPLPEHLRPAASSVFGHSIAAAADHERALAQMREVFALDGEQLAQLGDTAARLAQVVSQTVEQVGQALADLAKALAPLAEHLRPDLPPVTLDPRARALWLRQHRNTGPQAPRAQAAHRPRRHR